MKKITNLLIVFLMSLFAFSCSNGLENNEKVLDNSNIETLEYGSTELKMFVPDYYLMAESKNGGRVVSPQTAYVQLSAYNSISDQWNTFQKVALEDAEVTPVENAPEGFSGSVYTLVFSKVYAKTYAADTLKVDLMSASGVIISSGTNATAVTVRKGENSTTSFFTLPVDSSKDESSLSSGEMKFCKFNLQANTHYTLHMQVTGSVYPDIVIFNENGTLSDYYVIDDEDSCQIDFPANATSERKYIGVWADDGAYVSKYSINLYTDLTDFTFKDSSIGFWAGENYQIDLTPIPSDSYLGKVTYTSSNDKITVSENGLISGAEEAEGIITVSYNGIVHTIAVNVYESAVELTGVLSGDNLHWTKENSPYKVTGNVLVEENEQLIIDAGAKVYFTGNYYIKMNGSISAVGTKEDPIIITKATSYSGTWDGLRIGGGSLSTTNTYTYSSGNILKYVDFSYANTPVILSRATYVDHCNFRDCLNSVSASDNSILINNVFESGLGCNSGYVVNNIINSNLDMGWARVIVMNNTINEANIKISYYRHQISNNVFNGGTWNIYYDLNNIHIRNNNFINYNETVVSIRESHDSYKTVDFTGNYWGESQTAELIANEATGEKNLSFIYDYRDDFNYTEVDYSGWVREPIEGVGYQGDSFIAFDYTVNGYNWNNGGCYPESKNTELTIAVNPQYHTNEITNVRIAQGYDNLFNSQWQTYSNTISYTADLENLTDGYAPIYVQVKDSKGNESSAVCHKVPFDSPVITCSLTDGRVYTNPTEKEQWTWTFTDNTRIKKYAVLLDGIDVRSDSYSSGWDENPLTRDDNYIGLYCMPSGSHSLEIKVWDIANNLTTKEISFSINNTNSNVSSLENVNWDSTSGQFKKDEQTTYLWHLDSDGTEVDNSSTGISDYTNAIGGFGGGCASRVYTNDSIPLDVSTNEFTVEYWIKGSTQNDKPYLIVEKGDSFTLKADYERFYYLDEDENVQNKYYRGTQRPESDTEWHYVAKVYNGSYFANYIDGVLTNFEDEIDVNLINNDSKLYMSSQYIDAIDEVRISKAARSADEIKAYYDCAKDKIQ